MKQLISGLVAAAVMISCAGPAKRIFTSSGEFHLRPHMEVTLKNGLKVILIEDQTLPLISMGLLLRVGSAQDPKGQSGLTDLVADLLDKGTRRHTAVEIADSMAQYGGEFATSTGKDATYISGSVLSFHEDEFIAQFGEIVTEASFPDVEIDRLKKRRLAELKQNQDEPEAVLDQSFEALLFAKTPYEKPVSGLIGDVRRLTKKQIIKHYLQYYRPSNAQLAVVGKFSPKIIQELENAFAGWQDRPVQREEKFQFPEVTGRKIYVIDKGDMQQAQIRMGHGGIARSNPDYLPLRLVGVMLGGGFRSRLMNETRVKRGLTYSINAAFEVRLNPGTFEISTFTRFDKIGETVKETLRVVQEFHDQGPTESELNEAKALMKGQFPRSLETPEALASSLLYLRFYGVPDSYLTTYLREVDRVSLADMKRVIKEHIHPEDLKVIVHAPKKKAVPELEGVGPITVYPVNQFL